MTSQGLGRLTTLIIKHAKLSEVPQGLFDYLPTLITLELKDNDLKVGSANLEAYGREAEAAAQRTAEAERELGEIAAATATLNAELEALSHSAMHE